MKANIKEAISIYGVGTRVLTSDGPGIIRAVYDYKCLIRIDDNYLHDAKGLDPSRLPAPIEYWKHDSPSHFHGELYKFDELKLILRKWNSLRPEEIEALDWDNQSIYWAKKSKKGIITYNEEAPQTLRPNEYLFFIKLKIDIFDFNKDGFCAEDQT